jgi:hypothetical protein
MAAITVVTCVHNREQFLAATIESVLGQTFQDFVYIILDDGSTDSSLDIARRFAQTDDRIEVISGWPRQGVTKATQHALSKVKTEFFGMVDSDDLLHSEALAETYRALQAAPTAGLVYTQYDEIDQDGKFLRQGTRFKTPYSREALNRNFMVFHFRLIRTEAYRMTGGISADPGPIPDYEIVLRIANEWDIQYLPQILYSWRSHEGNISRDLQAVEDATERMRQNPALRMQDFPRGVIYGAIGEKHLQLAIASAMSVAQHNPELSILIVTDQPQMPIDCQHRIFILTIDTEQWTTGVFQSGFERSRLLKTSLNKFSPFRVSLYMDNDTLCRGSLEPIWEVLGNRSFAAAVDQYPTVGECIHACTSEKDATLAQLGAESTQFNGGVLLWRKGEESRQIFDTWRREWELFRRIDQLALARALQYHQVAILPEIYNFPATFRWTWAYILGSDGITEYYVPSGSPVVIGHFLGPKPGLWIQPRLIEQDE